VVIIPIIPFIDKWLVVSTYPSEKYDFVSCDDDIPNIWKVIKNVPNHQPIGVYPIYYTIHAIDIDLCHHFLGNVKIGEWDNYHIYIYQDSEAPIELGAHPRKQLASPA